MWSTLNKRSKFKVNFKFIVETLKYPQKIRRGRLFDERISNYGSITYWKITRAQKLAAAPPLKFQKWNPKYSQVTIFSQVCFVNNGFLQFEYFGGVRGPIIRCDKFIWDSILGSGSLWPRKQLFFTLAFFSKTKTCENNFTVKKPCFENDCNKSKAQQKILVLLKKSTSKIGPKWAQNIPSGTPLINR